MPTCDNKSILHKGKLPQKFTEDYDELHRVATSLGEKKNVQGRVATLITDERQTYRPRLPTAANTTITQTMIAARKRIMSTIMNAITATCTQQCKHTVHSVNNCN